jgi:hypothetical protein
LGNVKLFGLRNFLSIYPGKNEKNCFSLATVKNSRIWVWKTNGALIF